MEKLFYVYVYIDPRNFQEFYYGKGKDSRKSGCVGCSSGHFPVPIWDGHA